MNQPKLTQSAGQTVASPTSSDDNKIIEERRQKLNLIRENQGIAYTNSFKPTHHVQNLQEKFGDMTKEALEAVDAAEKTVRGVGRVLQRRIMGKASFCTLQDWTGKIQLYVTRDELPENFYNQSFKKWDLADIVGYEGYLFKTNTDELSVHVTHIELISKALRPLPDKFYGLADEEIKVRQRYLDLIVNPESRRVFTMRSRIVQEIRNFFIARDYLEVETPMMHAIPGGALAKPFETHHNALDMPLFLRIAPELFLKRLVVGGFERVFEINRCFRNEGISTRHNPEFTTIEFYQAYADYLDLIDLTEKLLRDLAHALHGSGMIEYQGHQIDFDKPLRRVSMLTAIQQHDPALTDDKLADIDFLRGYLKQHNIAFNQQMGLGKLHTILFEEFVEGTLIQPTFIIDYPAETSPLARRNDSSPEVTDRFELFIAGREIANGFSELNDPEDQAARFKQQVEAMESGDDEAMHFDKDYIKALEHGLPPTAGEGIGIDRLVMLFTNQTSIRDVILFPHLRQ